MSEHFIKEIEIKNYKLFKDFRADGFGRVNLIGGKNNVGKTAFMEAIGINAHAIDIESLFSAIVFVNFQRNKLENSNIDNPKELFEKTSQYYSKSNIREVGFSIIRGYGKVEYSFKIDGREIILNANEFSYQINKIDNIYFIDSFGFSNFWLKEVYISVQRKDKEETLNSYINQFDPNIEKFKIFDNSPECRLKDSKEYRDINEFGGGLKQFVSIISALYACENGYLFIDEIDNGIHYSKLDLLLEIIITLSTEQNVQLFATTHSKECIEFYARVAKKLKDKDTKFIKLTKLENRGVIAGVRDYDMLQYALEDGHEVR